MWRAASRRRHGHQAAVRAEAAELELPGVLDNDSRRSIRQAPDIHPGMVPVRQKAAVGAESQPGPVAGEASESMRFRSVSDPPDADHALVPGVIGGDLEGLVQGMPETIGMLYGPRGPIGPRRERPEIGHGQAGDRLVAQLVEDGGRFLQLAGQSDGRPQGVQAGEPLAEAAAVPPGSRLGSVCTEPALLLLEDLAAKVGPCALRLVQGISQLHGHHRGDEGDRQEKQEGEGREPRHGRTPPAPTLEPLVQPGAATTDLAVLAKGDEVVRQLIGRRVPTRRVLVDRLEDDRLQVARDLAVDGRGGLGWPCSMRCMSWGESELRKAGSKVSSS